MDWIGWKLHTVLFASFKALREPIGPSKIDHIVFASSKYACGEPLPDTRIKLDDMRFISSTAQHTEDVAAVAASAVADV